MVAVLLAYCVTVLVGAADWFIGQGLEGGIAKISADDDKFGPRAASLLKVMGKQEVLDAGSDGFLKSAGWVKKVLDG